MLNLIKWVLHRHQAAPRSEPLPVSPLPPVTITDALYQPNDGRLVIVRSKEIIAHHRQDLADVVQALGISPDRVDSMVMQPLVRFANLVLNLPATRDDYYRGAGGFFRMGLDSALFAARVAQQTEFAGLGMIERRRRHAPRWRLATLLAALCSDLHRVMTAYVVIAPDNQEWAPLLHPLESWVAAGNYSHVQLTWKGDGETPRDHRAWNLSLVRHIITPDMQQYLHDGDSDILRQLHAYLSDNPSAAHGNVIRDIVENIRMKLIAKDLALDPMRFGKKSLGTTLGPHLADCLRALRSSGKWTVNDDKGLIWVAEDATYLIWPPAAKEVIKWLQEMRLHGTPTDQHTLAELLRDGGIIKPYQRGNDTASLIWPIRLPKGRETGALRLVSNDILWPDGDVPPAVDVKLQSVKGSQTTPKPAPIPNDQPVAAVDVAAQVAPMAPSPPVPVAVTKKQPSQNEERSRISRLKTAVEALDGASKAQMYLLIEKLKVPAAASEIIFVREDNRIELSEAFLGSNGFSSVTMCEKLGSARWLEDFAGKYIVPSKSPNLKRVCIITKQFGDLLLPLPSTADLFSSPSE